MLCDVCQTRPAKIFYTEIVNGQKKEQHLCEQCASEHTIVPLNEMMNGQGLSSIGSILSGILSNYAKDRGKSLDAEKKGETICPECGTTESEFLKTGRIGCPVCYNVFRDMIAKNFKTMQGGMVHTGKEPSYARFIQIDDAPAAERRSGNLSSLDKKFDLDNDEEFVELPDVSEKKKRSSSKSSEKKKKETGIEELKEKMKNAVAEEDYELAAKLRDEIKSLEDEKETGRKKASASKGSTKAKSSKNSTKKKE